MAVVHSLVCWGGSSGKSVTVNASTDLVTLSNHGLRSAFEVAFTSGSLPSVAGAALALDTTYYAKPIAATTFELYYDSGLTSKINFTSTGSALIMKSAYYIALADKSRWTTGTERIYDGLYAWKTARAGAALTTDVEVAEIAQAFTEFAGASSSFSTATVPCGQARIETMIDGVRTPAFHGGVISTGGVDAGFVLDNNAASMGGNWFTLGRAADSIDGFTLRQTASYGITDMLTMQGATSKASNMIVIGISGGFAPQTAIRLQGARTFAFNCVAMGAIAGFNITNYADAPMIAGCTATRNTKGFDGGSVMAGYYYNNIAIGNTSQDWSTTPPMTNVQGAACNGGTTGTIWTKSGGATYTVGTGDVVDWAAHDLRPDSASSPQVDVGTDFFLSVDFDIADVDRPSYENGAATAMDLGAYEFDHGYGPWPSLVTVTFDGVVIGSSIRIEESVGGALVEYRVATSTSEAFSFQSGLAVRVKVRKASASPNYRPWETVTTPTTDQSIFVSQIPDE